MGLLDPIAARPDLWSAATAPRLARAVRLRRDLGLSYSAALLVAELVERIDDLEARLRPYRGGTMDPSRLTQKTHEALQEAQSAALRLGHTETDVEHVLLALLDQGDGLVAAAAVRAEVNATSCARR